MGIIEESNKNRKVGFFGVFKKRKFYIGVFVLMIVAGFYYFFVNSKVDERKEVSLKEWVVQKGDIRLAIESDGKVVAEDGVELSFSVNEKNLEIESVFVKEGDKIKKGDKIVTVKTDTLRFNLQNAYANYQSALADYNEVIEGPTDNEVKKSETTIAQARLSLEQAKINLDKLNLSNDDKIVRAEDALRLAREKMEENRDEFDSEDVDDAYSDLVNTIKSVSIAMKSMLPDSDKIIGEDNKSINDKFESSLGVKNISTVYAAASSYNNAKNKVIELEAESMRLVVSGNYSDIDDIAQKAKVALDLFEGHLYAVQLMLEASITSIGLSQDSLNSFKSIINSNRSAINSKIAILDASVQAVVDAKKKIEDYKDDYDEALRDLEVVKKEVEQDIVNAEKNVEAKELALKNAVINHEDFIAPLTAAESASAKSRLTSASVSLQKAQLELEKATIISPIDGEVVRLNYKVGDIIIDNSTSEPVAVILNSDTLFIQVDIEEADINKIKVGQVAKAEFDALDGLVLDGEISFISLTSKTSNNGIVTYMVRVLVNNSSGVQIREGMTAFVDFITAEVEDVLMIPVEAVRNVDGKPSVQSRDNQWVPVVTGFTDGKKVEVISGVSAGDKVVY